jgi:hypothetical protein
MTAKAVTLQEIQLRRIWETLPVTPLNREELSAAILQATGSGNHLAASTILAGLESVEVLRVRVVNGERMYTRTETWPDLSDRGPGSKSVNEYLAGLALAERERFASADLLAWNASPMKRERDELVALMREVATEVFDEKLAELTGPSDKPTTAAGLREWITNRTQRSAA